MRLRRVAVLGTVAAILGCAVGKAPYVPPVDIPLQDPPPGQSVIYLIRAPYDEISVQVFVNARRVAVLPSSTYTALALDPGTYNLITHSMQAQDEIAPAFKLQVKSGERLLLNLSGTTGQFKNEVRVGVIGTAIVPIASPARRSVTGGRSWKVVSELDAQGLMSIAKVTLPE